MKNLYRKTYLAVNPALTSWCVVFAGFLLLFATQARTEVALPSDLSNAEMIRLGERMYRNGVLPSGKVMDTFSPSSAEASSTAFTCSSCHLRAGLGSVEGVVITPPAVGSKLYKPYDRLPVPDLATDRSAGYSYAKTVAQRPAYNRESLARAIRTGVDPAGRVFNDVMPRYQLEDRDMAILIAYLEDLSSKPSPGANERQFAFATVIAGDVSPEERQAMLQPLRYFIDHKNRQTTMFNDFKDFGYIPTIEMKYAFRQATLDVWELTGPAETWPGQLAAHYEKKPVFAILGGISKGDWRPIHDFCEARQIPCLFPITDFPAISETGWYTYYFNKGLYQEGEAVARYLSRMTTLSDDTPVLQIVQDSAAGRALAAGFQETWNELDRPAVTTLTLEENGPVDRKALLTLVKKQKPGVLLLWTDQRLLLELPALISRLPDKGFVFVSSGFLGKQTMHIPPKIRDRVYITYPYRLTPYVGNKDGGYDAKVPILATAADLGDRRIASRSMSMLQQVILRSLNLLYDDLNRDHLLDILSMQMDVVAKDYEQLNFGIGQRYVSRGCYIIQLGPGKDPPLLPRSEWIIH